VLRDVYQLSYNEIAEGLGIPLGTVKSTRRASW
jgi:DNA-directed RNA polymerase specialized sigma24 family protein